MAKQILVLIWFKGQFSDTVQNVSVVFFQGALLSGLEVGFLNSREVKMLRTEFTLPPCSSVVLWKCIFSSFNFHFFQSFLHILKDQQSCTAQENTSLGVSLIPILRKACILFLTLVSLLNQEHTPFPLGHCCLFPPALSSPLFDYSSACTTAAEILLQKSRIKWTEALLWFWGSGKCRWSQQLHIVCKLQWYIL